ncbi:hypothetical protein CPB83DRAFT_789134 [Crepidotus variabilis]|uniref:FAD/NAD(P)-binding domain-containing protein n=1 Tax=Crepidotus variabilis TaxID=179855 RepID=A0A9P6EJN3_9AGAR|nr:hypothetical protein CPB83DRAFT_789134 [Crepidotus variabilis]
MASATEAIRDIVAQYADDSKTALHMRNIFTLLSPFRLWAVLWNVGYVIVQLFIIKIFKPARPNARKALANPHGRVAVIGAGITGVSSAAHALAHGFEVVIFEQAPYEKLGGIWANVNKTSALQINSMIYRFHPGVMWKRGFPRRDEILSEVHRIWKEYYLDARTRFNTKVTSVQRSTPPDDGSWDHDRNRSRWIINDGSEGSFDAVIVTIGTCGDPNWIKLPGMPEHLGEDGSSNKNHDSPTSDSPGPDTKHSNAGGKPEPQEKFEKIIIHSSQLDSPDFQLKGGEKVVIIGSGASGVEAVETVLDKFGSVKDPQGGESKKQGVEVFMIARDDKWIIPRNIVMDTVISAQPFGREMPLSFVWERLLRRFQYKGVENLAPQGKGLYEGTPVVNDDFLSHIREGRCNYIRGSPVRLTSKGVMVTGRKKKPGKDTKMYVPKEGVTIDTVTDGAERLYEADVVVLATGYKRPSLDFLPKDLFPEGYERPDLYLQNFSTEDWSILMTNSSYVNAIGTVGHFHIGIYTRILLTLLLDPSARPQPKDMKLWVDTLRFIKRGASGGALGFFTYMELTLWLFLFHILRPDRLRWMFFILNGWGVHAQE